MQFTENIKVISTQKIKKPYTFLGDKVFYIILF